MKWHHANTSGHEVEYEAVVPSSTVVFKAVIEVTPAGIPHRATFAWEWDRGDRRVEDGLIYTHGTQPDHLAALVQMVGFKPEHTTPTEAV